MTDDGEEKMTDYDEAFEKLNLRFTMHNRENI
jgi:hypothetical protein